MSLCALCFNRCCPWYVPITTGRLSIPRGAHRFPAGPWPAAGPSHGSLPRRASIRSRVCVCRAMRGYRWLPADFCLRLLPPEAERAFSDNEISSETARPPLSRRVSTHPAAKKLLRRYASLAKVTPLNPTAKFSESDIVWRLLRSTLCCEVALQIDTREPHASHSWHKIPLMQPLYLRIYFAFHNSESFKATPLLWYVV